MNHHHPPPPPSNAPTMTGLQEQLHDLEEQWILQEIEMLQRKLARIRQKKAEVSKPIVIKLDSRQALNRIDNKELTLDSQTIKVQEEVPSIKSNNNGLFSRIRKALPTIPNPKGTRGRLATGLWYKDQATKECPLKLESNPTMAIGYSTPSKTKDHCSRSTVLAVRHSDRDSSNRQSLTGIDISVDMKQVHPQDKENHRPTVSLSHVPESAAILSSWKGQIPSQHLKFSRDIINVKKKSEFICPVHDQSLYIPDVKDNSETQENQLDNNMLSRVSTAHALKPHPLEMKGLGPCTGTISEVAITPKIKNTMMNKSAGGALPTEVLIMIRNGVKLKKVDNNKTKYEKEEKSMDPHLAEILASPVLAKLKVKRAMRSYWYDKTFEC